MLHSVTMTAKKMACLFFFISQNYVTLYLLHIYTTA